MKSRGEKKSIKRRDERRSVVRWIDERKEKREEEMEGEDKREEEMKGEDKRDEEWREQVKQVCLTKRSFLMSGRSHKNASKITAELELHSTN